MRRWFRVVSAVAFLTVAVLAGNGWAQEKVYVLDNIVVNAEPEAPGEDRLSQRAIESGRFTNTGEALAELPGVSLVRRAAGATEPVIRGMGWERVATQVGALPLYGACPSRMDPPITYVKPHATDDVTVIKGLPSVTLGPGGTGGRIVINTDYERSPDDPETLDPWIRMSYDTAREGIAGEAGVAGGNRFLDFRAAAEALNFNDYETGGGVTVPANQDGYSGTVSLGIRPTEQSRWWNTLAYVREESVDYPSLPMNLDETDYWNIGTGYRLERDGGFLAAVEASFGIQLIDHVMSNRGKPSRMMMENETPSESDAYGGKLNLDLRVTDSLTLAVGGDYYTLSRDALRTRFLVGTGQTFYDHIWPDADQSDLGGFAELSWWMTDRLNLRLGGRIDQVESEANGADDPGLQMRTVRENFIRFYGPEAADTDRDETLGSGNLLVEYAPADEWIVHLGGGVSTRAAGITERYFAFAPGPGGFLVGNPTLDAETKYEVSGGIKWEREGIALSVSGFHHWVRDYIYSTAVDRIDVNGDGNPDLIRGFFNTDARLYGGESTLILGPWKGWRFPLTLSYVRGKNTGDERDLPEIPPLEGTAAAIYESGGSTPWWAEFGGRFVDNQDKIDETFPEDETPGYGVFHLRFGVTVAETLKLQAGIENLFDKEYHEHLTRETFISVGDLMTGDEVGAPGRSVYVSARVDF